MLSLSLVTLGLVAIGAYAKPMVLSLDTIFTCLFPSIFNPTSFTFLKQPFLLMFILLMFSFLMSPHAHEQHNKDTIQLA